jgi:hypothetical protein
MLLDSTTDSLQVILGAAITTNQLPFVVSYNDMTSSAITPTKNVGTTNSTTAVDLIPAPSSSHTRQLRYCSVYNADTVPQLVTIRFNDNGTFRSVFVVTLLPNETLQYAYGKGWNAYNSSGSVRVVGINQTMSDIRIPEGFFAAGVATTLTMTSGTDYCFYLGKADRAYSTIYIQYNVTTALGASITWAELAIYNGTPTIGSGITPTRVGYTDCAAIFNGTGIKTTAVTITGVQEGDDIWAVFGSVTSGTAMQIRAGVADDVSTGFMQTATGSLRPSTNTTIAFTITASGARGWLGWQGL